MSGSETIVHEWEAGALLVDGQPVVDEPEWRLLYGRYQIEGPLHVAVDYAHGDREYSSRMTLDGDLDAIFEGEMPHQVEVEIHLHASASGLRLEERAVAEVWAVHLETLEGAHAWIRDPEEDAAHWTERWRLSIDVRTERLEPVFLELHATRVRRELTRSHPPQPLEF